jgi:outer membrane protein TolC
MKARDTGNISTNGLSVSLSLPLFDGNRGNIAVERATRQQLHDEYSARLLADRNDVQRLARDLRDDRALRATLAAHAAQLDEARGAAETSYAAGRLDWPTYLAVRANSLAADTALLALEQDMHETAIALDALVGNWPDAALVRNDQAVSAKDAKDAKKNR